MKEYILCLIFVFLLTVPFDAFFRQARAEAAVVSNTIYDSQVYQYIIVGCADDPCRAWLKDFLAGAGNEYVVIDDLPAGEKVVLELNEEQPAPAEAGDATEAGETIVVDDSSAEQSLAAENDTTAAADPSVEQGSDSGNNSDAVAEKEDEAEISIPAAAGQDSPAQNAPVATVGLKQIRINEIVSAPVSGQNEWVELFNSTQNSVDLSGWYLIEGGGKKTALFGSIGPQGYLVFDKSSLNNGGDAVILQDSSGREIDRVSYGDWESVAAPASRSGNSLIWWNDDYLETEVPTPRQQNIFQLTLPSEPADNTVPVAVQTAAVEAENKPVAPVEPAVEDDSAEKAIEAIPQEKNIHQLSDQIIISEFLPDPLGADDLEWIELYNRGNKDVNLFGWSLDDAEGGSKPHKIQDQLVIKAHDYLVFGKEETGLVLNNSSDRVALFDPNGIIESSVNYQNPKENFSQAFIDGGWQASSVLTPGQENKLPALQVAQFSGSENENITAMSQSGKKIEKPSGVSAISLDQVKLLPLKSKVKTTGRVAVLPGVFGKSVIYLGGSGMQVYFSSGDWPELKLGDLVEVVGTVSESYNEKRILLKNKLDLRVIESGELEGALSIDSDLIGEDVEGRLIQIVGEIVSKEANKMVLADEAGEFTVYLKQGAKISPKIFELGDNIQVTGILSQYNDEYRILPRGEVDMENLSLREKPATGAVQSGDEQLPPDGGKRKTIWLLLSGFLFLLGANLYFLWQRRDAVWRAMNVFRLGQVGLSRLIRGGKEKI